MMDRTLYRDSCRAASLFVMFLLVIGIAQALPSIDSFSPANSDIIILESESQLFNVTVSPANSSIQWYLDDVGVSSSQEYLFGSDYSSAGNYEVKIWVSDNNQSVSRIWNLHVENVDTTPPQVLYNSPSGALATKYVTLNITTDEPSMCKYDINDVVYSSMTKNLTGTGSTHFTHLTLTEGPHNYYVRCIDSSGNFMVASSLISFWIDVAPHASIALNGNSPFTAGTYEITLISSKNLQSSPYLYYSIDGSSSTRQVSLSGENSLWTGYLIIPDDNSEKVATFHYSGIDMEGNTGTKIDSGELFLIDTLEPSLVDSFDIEVDEDDEEIELEWYFEEDCKDFRVYRSGSPGITKTDYYDSSSSEEYYDSDVDPGKTYYYRVAAVDNAGNEGPLSKELNARIPLVKPVQSDIVEQSVITEDSPPKTLDPLLVPLVNNTLKNVDNRIFEVSVAISDLKNVEEYPEKDIIAGLEIVSNSELQLASLQSLRKEVGTYLTSDIQEAELAKRIDKVTAKVNAASRLTPTQITIIGQTDFIAVPTERDVTNAIDSFLQESNMTDKQKQQYIRDSLDLKVLVEVRNMITAVSIEYLDSHLENKTLVVKEVSSKDASVFDNVHLVELIPKSVENRARDIDFKTPLKAVLEEDPVVLWDFARLDYEKKTISYVIDSRVSSEDAKKIVSVVLQDTLTSASANQITGFAIFDDSDPDAFQYITGLLGIFIIVGLLGYYVFIRGSFSVAAKQDSVSLSLEKAHGLIDDAHYSESFRLYNRLNLVFSQKGVVLPQDKLARFNLLGHKLSLYNQIQSAHKYSSMNDYVMLRESLSKLQTHYNTVLSNEKEYTPLIFYARQQYLHYFSIYNYFRR